jgi:hypothetical protein
MSKGEILVTFNPDLVDVDLEAGNARLQAELASREIKQSAERGQLYLQIDDLKADNVMLRSRLRQARELIDEVASQCPEENDWLDVARRWLAAEIAREGLK